MRQGWTQGPAVEAGCQLRGGVGGLPQGGRGVWYPWQQTGLRGRGPCPGLATWHLPVVAPDPPHLVAVCQVGFCTAGVSSGKSR